MESISIIGSAFTGINVTIPDAPIVINNCTVQSNKGKTPYSPSNCDVYLNLAQLLIFNTVIASYSIKRNT